jgi:hypothetical protein
MSGLQQPFIQTEEVIQLGDDKTPTDSKERRAEILSMIMYNIIHNTVSHRVNNISVGSFSVYSVL